VEVDGASHIDVFKRVRYFARLIDEVLHEKGFRAIGISGIGVLGVFFFVLGRVVSKVVVDFCFFEVFPFRSGCVGIDVHIKRLTHFASWLGHTQSSLCACRLSTA